jgi:hypothetical protein
MFCITATATRNLMIFIFHKTDRKEKHHSDMVQLHLLHCSMNIVNVCNVKLQHQKHQS